MEDRHFFLQRANKAIKKKQRGLICGEDLICGGLISGEIRYFQKLGCTNIFVVH